MSRFAFIRRLHMKKKGGFWVRRKTIADLPLFPAFPWRWIEPGEGLSGQPPWTPGDFERNPNLVVHALEKR